MKPLVLLSFSLAFLTHGFADDYLATDPSEQANTEQQPEVPMSMEPEEAPWCLSPYHEFHASIRHNEANGIGYKNGYSTLEVFGIYDGYGSGFMPFFDLRGHIFNDGKGAGNVGIGERTLFESINHTFGSYLYYDVRTVGHGLTVNQLSPGIELVGERMEYRVNGYFPLGKRKSREYGFKFDKFSGHSIILKGKQQQSMMGFDAEVGVHLTQSTTYDVYAGAGPYYFNSSNAQAWGGKVRLLGRYKEYVTLEVAYSHDKLFHNVVQGSLAFTLPFGEKLQRCGKCCPQTDNLLLSRAAFAPSRFEIPVVKRVNKREKAIDPATGQPWVVWFVNNTSHSAGTFESPFPTLLQAQNASSPNNMIYVFSGDGTTHGMNAGITLKDGQTFFGSGIAQQFATTKGTKTIPAMSSSNPTITSTTGSVVTLGNSNVVSGFNAITDFSAPVIIGSNSNNTTIINNIIVMDSNDNGIQFTGSGTINIFNNQFNDLSGDAGTAIVVSPIAGKTMNGVINHNFINGFINGIFIDPNANSLFDLTVAGNTVINNTAGGSSISADMGGQSMLKIIGNTVKTDFSDNAIALNPGISNQLSKVLIDSNNIVINSAAATGGIAVTLDSKVNLEITNNTVRSTKGAGFTGIEVAVSNPGNVCLDLNTNTVVTVPGATAYGFTATSPGVINMDSIQGNIGGPVSSTGNVNLVAPGTCGN